MIFLAFYAITIHISTCCGCLCTPKIVEHSSIYVWALTIIIHYYQNVLTLVFDVASQGQYILLTNHQFMLTTYAQSQMGFSWVSCAFYLDLCATFNVGCMCAFLYLFLFFTQVWYSFDFAKPAVVCILYFLLSIGCH